MEAEYGRQLSLCSIWTLGVEYTPVTATYTYRQTTVIFFPFPISPSSPWPGHDTDSKANISVRMGYMLCYLYYSVVHIFISITSYYIMYTIYVCNIMGLPSRHSYLSFWFRFDDTTHTVCLHFHLNIKSYT